MPEIYRTSLRLDRRREELRFILTKSSLRVELYRAAEDPGAAVFLCRLNLPLSSWPQFHEAVHCLGAFMIPLPAPAYQARSCCSYTCSPSPEPVVLALDPQAQIGLSLQDRRGSTFLEIKSVHSAVAGPEENCTISIGPTLWSAFLTTLQTLAEIIADL